MKSIYLNYRGREWTITDEAYKQIVEIASESLLCSTCKNPYAEDNRQVAVNTCLACFLVHEQRHGITFLDQAEGHFRFLDPRGEIRVTDVDSTESRVSITETIRYHGFRIPHSIVVNGETKTLSEWQWHIHGEKTRSCVILQNGSTYGSETLLFLAYKNGSFVELHKRKRTHRELLQRARNQIEASKDKEGYFHVAGRRFYGMYESSIWEVAAEIASIEFDISGQGAGMIVVYHVFTDGKDLWTQNYRFARKLYTYWKKANGAARLYKEVYETEEGMLNDEMIEEDCLLSFGPFPS